MTKLINCTCIAHKLLIKITFLFNWNIFFYDFFIYLVWYMIAVDCCYFDLDKIYFRINWLRLTDTYTCKSSAGHDLAQFDWELLRGLVWQTLQPVLFLVSDRDLAHWNFMPSKTQRLSCRMSVVQYANNSMDDRTLHSTGVLCFQTWSFFYGTAFWWTFKNLNNKHKSSLLYLIGACKTL